MRPFLVDEILATELSRGNIHRNPDVVRPMLGFGAGGFKNPIADLTDETTLLGNGNEF